MVTPSPIISQLIIPMLAAFGCGFILGLDRELAHKPAGLRTQVLIILGVTIFVLAGQLFGQEPTRISANVLTGLGFLGAGVVLQHRGTVRGMTTAALIWVNGSLGLAIGLRQYLLAGFGIVMVLAALRILGALEQRMKTKCYPVWYTVRSQESERVLAVVRNAIAHGHLQEQPLTFSKTEEGQIVLRFAFCNPPQRHDEFVEVLRQLPEIMAVDIET
jgi:putative Mg2+ transporter-C (MgtC) family protein